MVHAQIWLRVPDSGVTRLEWNNGQFAARQQTASFRHTYTHADAYRAEKKNKTTARKETSAKFRRINKPVLSKNARSRRHEDGII